MSIEPQTKENTFLINKDWADDDTLEKIVDRAYLAKKIDKNVIVARIQKLKENDLIVLGDWKELCTHTTFLERCNKYNDGLVLLLDRVACVEPENVRLRKLKKK
jgi:hypothetical protein